MPIHEQLSLHRLQTDTRAFACDIDHDLAVAIDELLQHRRKWRAEAAVGKTVVSSRMIDRIIGKRRRKLYGVPVGFKWFVEGLLGDPLGFHGWTAVVPREGTKLANHHFRDIRRFAMVGKREW